jgi:RNA polymerase sigma-70 factor (ECF subfamily)
LRQTIEREASQMDEAEADTLLLQRIATGDRQALADLYTRHQRALFRYLLQLTPDQALAEEILQDTLVAAWQGAATFGARSAVRTWLFGIARRQAHNRLRQRGLPLEDADVLLELPAPDPDPQDAVLAGAEREELAQALRQLTAPHREVLLLVLVDDLSYQDAAQVLGVPVGTVKSRLNHARSALRAQLAAQKEHDI